MGMKDKQHILSLSYGKDSLACLGAIEQIGWKLDRIIHAEVWATETIPADLPEMVKFKGEVDEIIEARYGIKVEHVSQEKCGRKITYDSVFHKTRSEKSANPGKIYGWPTSAMRGAWCTGELKQNVLKETQGENIVYLGIAADEPNRFHNLTGNKRSPLVEAGWSEAYCRRWCEENGLLSPIYTSSLRGGCWFCHNQSVNQLRLLRKNYPDLWALMLKWDDDSPVPFKTDGHTVHDFDKRFCLEEEGLINPNERFYWEYIKNVQLTMDYAIRRDVTRRRFSDA